MKKSVLSFLLAISSIFAMAQYPTVTIKQIMEIPQQNLQNCNDSSLFFGDTVTIVAYAVHDGGLSEVASGSVQGGNRPFVFFNDTTNGGAIDSWTGIEVMGVVRDNSGNLVPVTNFTDLIAGDVVEMTGVVESFRSSTQFTLLNDNSFSIIGSIDTSAIQPVRITVGDLNDNQRVNNLETGEQYENVFVEITDVTVVNVNFFSNDNRVSFDVADQNGNLMNVSDRFLAQRLPAHQVVNPSSPNATANGGPGTGTFNAPSVGDFFSSIKGVVRHDGNGCLAQTAGITGGRGYELNPYDDSHYVFGAPRPVFDNLARTPLIPTSTDVVNINVEISDADGTIDTALLYYTVVPNPTFGDYTVVTLSRVGTSDLYNATIPAQTNLTEVNFFFRAVDNDNSVTWFPFTAPNAVNTPNSFSYQVNDAGMTIVAIQRVPNPSQSDASPFVGETVTVSGVVTASEEIDNLGYTYIQQRNEMKWAGINLYGSPDLGNLSIGDSVEVTGEVVESFGFTRLNVSSVNNRGSVATIDAVELDPSDASIVWEEYEGMLVKLANTAGKININNPDLNFGEYSVGSGASASTTFRVLTGRSSGSAFGSLNVSLVSRTLYATTDGNMRVPLVLTADTIEMDTYTGIVYYSFSNYKLTPRNNADIENLSVPFNPAPIAAPEILPATNVTDSSFVANWNAGGGETEWLLTVSLNDDLSSPLTNYDESSVFNTASAVSGLSEDTRYYYAVKAVSPLAGILGDSELSDIASVVTLEGDTNISTADFFVKNQIVVYPNPATNNVFIKADELNNGMTINIVNLSGQIVMHQAISSGISIDISGLAKGVYSVQLLNNESIQAQTKLIVIE